MEIINKKTKKRFQKRVKERYQDLPKKEKGNSKR